MKIFLEYKILYGIFYVLADQILLFNTFLHLYMILYMILYVFMYKTQVYVHDIFLSLPRTVKYFTNLSKKIPTNINEIRK